jgi:phosphate transport system protein
MSLHFHRELESLRKRILTLSTIVENAIMKAIQAVQTRDISLAEQIMNEENEVDMQEIEVEEDCLKILALYHPVAQDLRFIVAVLKINNDIERMGDHAANIAKRARYLAKRDPVSWPPELEQLAENVKQMVKLSLDALVNSDTNAARQVCRADDTVDRQKREITQALREKLLMSGSGPHESEVLIKMLDVPRHLERIADLATNIAEEVIYMVEGNISRHQVNRPE